MAKKKATKKSTISAGTGPEGNARVAQSRLKASGKTSRIQGHVSARTRRSQAKRDTRKS
jgi:hypothetical protein